MIKIIFFGTPNFVVPVLNTIKENFNLAGVVTASDKLVGRKQVLTPTPVKQATPQGISVLAAEKLTPDVAQQLKQLQPDLFVVAAYGKIIPKFILGIPKFGALNIHPSCLPKYRGPSPIQTAILNGDQTSCVTIIKMDEQMDHGPIVTTKEIGLTNQDTFESLSKKMFDEGADLLVKIISDFIAGKTKLVQQNHAIASYCPLIKKESGYFDINNPPSLEQLDHIIRAYYPWPGAWTKWEGKIVKFYPEKIIQMEGKKSVKLEDFLRGYPDFPIKNLK